MERGTAYIKRAVLDIVIRTADAETTHHAYEDIISKALQQELGTFIEAEIERLIPDDRRIVIDTLAIDIGSIAPGETHSEFVSRFRKAFPAALLKALPETPAGPEDAELVRYFLQNGSYPWWASHAPAHNLQELFSRLSVTAFTKLAAWIIEKRQHPGLLKRLYAQLDKPTLEQLADAFTGGAWPGLQEAFGQYDAFFTPGQTPANYLHWISEQLQQRSSLPANAENWERLYIEHKRLEQPGIAAAATPAALLKKAGEQTTAESLPEKQLALLREMLQRETTSPGEPLAGEAGDLHDTFYHFFSEGTLPPGMPQEQQESFLHTLLKTIPLQRPRYLRILHAGRTQPALLLRLFYQAGAAYRSALYAAFFPAAPVNETAELFRILYEAGMPQPDAAMHEARILAAAAFAQLRQLPQNSGAVIAKNIRPFLPERLPPRAAFIPILEDPAIAATIKNTITALLRQQEKRAPETFFTADALFLQLPAALQQEVTAHFEGHKQPMHREAFFSSALFRRLPEETQQQLIIHFTADAATPAALYHSPVFRALPAELQLALKTKLGVVPGDDAEQQLLSVDESGTLPEAVSLQLRELAAQVQRGAHPVFSSPLFYALPEAVRWELRTFIGTANSTEALEQQLHTANLKRYPVAVQEQLLALVQAMRGKQNAFFSSAFFGKLQEQKQREVRAAFRDYPEPLSATAFLASPAFNRLPAALQQEFIKILREQRIQSPDSSSADALLPETDTAAQTAFAITDPFLSDLLNHYALHEALPWWTAPLHHHVVFRKLFTGGVSSDHAAVFSAALHHFARYFPVAFGKWAQAVVTQPQFREFIFARLSQPEFERVSAALFPAAWPDVPQTIKYLLPLFAGTAAEAETSLRDVVAALLPWAGQPPKTVLLQLLRLLGIHFNKPAAAMQTLLLQQEQLPASLRQAAADWVALQEKETETDRNRAKEPLRLQHAAIALPLTALLNGQILAPALTARTAAASALLHELDEQPARLEELFQQLRRQPELISWLAGVLPETATAQLTQKLVMFENNRLQQSPASDTAEQQQLVWIYLLGDVISETMADDATARQHAHAQLLQELVKQHDEEKQTAEHLLLHIATLSGKPVTYFQLNIAAQMALVFAGTTTKSNATKLLSFPGSPAAMDSPEQLLRRWNTAITALLQPFTPFIPELKQLLAEKITDEAAQLALALQQPTTTEELNKRMQEHAGAVLQFVKTHIAQSIAMDNPPAVSWESEQPSSESTEIKETDFNVAENKIQGANNLQTDSAENKSPGSTTPESLNTEHKLPGQEHVKTGEADEEQPEVKQTVSVSDENTNTTSLPTETRLQSTLPEPANETPAPPGREAVLRNPVFFINSLLYFFTWKKLPWWSPYKSADELNAYAAAVVRERHTQLTHQLQALLENEQAQNEMVLFLAERLQETDFGSATLVNNRLRFGVLLHVARKTDNALAAFIETSQNLLQLPLFHAPEKDQVVAEKLYALLVEKLQLQFAHTQTLPPITDDERETMLQSVGYPAAAGEAELEQAIKELEQQLQQPQEKTVPVSDTTKINTVNETLIRPLQLQLEPVIPETVLQQVPATFVQQLSRYPQQERRTAWLAAVFTFFALHTGRSLRDVLNPAIRLSEKQSSELHQELLTLRQRPGFPYPDLLLEAELQALALHVNPGHELPYAAWHETVSALSSDSETQRLLLLTFAITETARVQQATAEQIAERFAAQLQHTGPEQEQLLHTPALLRTQREHLYLLDPENRNSYTDTLLQLKNRQTETRAEPSAPVAARVAAALLQQLVRDKNLLHALAEQETKKYGEQRKPRKADEPIEYITEKPAEGDPIYVFNAGLVLLWPFIGGLFRRLGYVSGKAFVSQEKRERAVLLLQYVIDEQHTHPPEHLLPLNKLLCGMHPTDPIEHMADLDDTEKQEAVAFLAAVKAQWEQMKNTSVDTFRRTFLKREGALVFKNDNWELQVQHIAVDVLLKKLPWGVSTVKFAWTPTILFVKWKI